VLEYQIENDNILFTHTLVPEALEGQGIGSQLAKAGLEYAKQNLYRVVPLCPFVSGYIGRHPEYQSLVRT
jgi:predicted GNAT family acetyltransferase